MNHIKKLLIASIALLPLSSCIVLAGAGAGYLISQEVLPGAIHQAQVKRDVSDTWAQTQITMRDLKVGDFEITDYPRRIETDVQGASVEVVVEAYDLNRTLIKVKASRYLTSDDEVASMILNRIVEDLGESR